MSEEKQGWPKHVAQGPEEDECLRGKHEWLPNPFDLPEEAKKEPEKNGPRRQCAE